MKRDFEIDHMYYILTGMRWDEVGWDWVGLGWDWVGGWMEAKLGGYMGGWV